MLLLYIYIYVYTYVYIYIYIYIHACVCINIRPWALCPQGVFIGALLVLWEGGLVCLEGTPPPALNLLALLAAPFFQSFFDMVLALTFPLILVPTWLQLASQLGSKIDQK